MPLRTQKRSTSPEVTPRALCAQVILTVQSFRPSASVLGHTCKWTTPSTTLQACRLTVSHRIVPRDSPALAPFLATETTNPSDLSPKSVYHSFTASERLDSSLDSNLYPSEDEGCSNDANDRATTHGHSSSLNKQLPPRSRLSKGAGDSSPRSDLLLDKTSLDCTPKDGACLSISMPSYRPMLDMPDPISPWESIKGWGGSQGTSKPLLTTSLCEVFTSHERI
eukprot:1186965-Prorocentrum_minimum.AAC.2